MSTFNLVPEVIDLKNFARKRKFPPSKESLHYGLFAQNPEKLCKWQ